MSAPSVAFELLLEDGTAVALDVAPDALGYHVVRDGAGLERTINAADPWAAVAGVARSMRLPSPLAAIRRRRARVDDGQIRKALAAVAGGELPWCRWCTLASISP